MMRPIALTMGDPAGIGGELTLAAWAALRTETVFYLIGDPDWMRHLGGVVREIASPSEATSCMSDALPVLPERLEVPVTLARPAPENAAPVVRSIERAVAQALSGEAAAVCTNPINKKALQDGANFAFPGHTEFLAHLCDSPRPVMMLAGPDLRVVPVTIHIPLSQVPAALTPELLEETLRVTHAGLRRDFGLASPHIAVSGLNPHAGEGGAMGFEDIDCITPVLRKLAAEGMRISGPYPADTMFHPRARATYDAAVCMYHDQALIPTKTLNFDSGVNVTLGLPIVRTSPDHGTAYDIAGRGVARPDSLIAALRLARDMAGARA
ncbi:4-hydroxythreonine-4-phosphate dehydrogenase PdxA [Paroceanicella profunda]|uniref:4-hydroxythreonine-4-phosphate dehydrogenase n=1 Tax=Paroceanicella profunda TaxID=2579971 RepID=A0A5B8G0E2_9RHOB|nr:4-hydroxythreonine-4-phosphate dehydrogenase PdxA [Paroceanicella profunda]QDL92502.1 4-hydroxythreonine-4-phosphate dehydrogenase PdxA [Paroceanicella profunda]